MNLFGYQIIVKKNKLRKKNKYGWLPDVPDHRDYKLAPPVDASAFPPLVDLAAQCPKVYNQGSIGSCTANAIAAAIEFDQMKQNIVQDFMPSRLFIYYYERALEGTINEDSGAQIRDGIKVVNTQGVCNEQLWPYSDSLLFKEPTSDILSKAIFHRSVQYQRIENNDINNIKACLVSGYPIVFGFTVYDFFESQEMASTGILHLPQSDEPLLGGHAVLCVGYDETKQVVKVRNSWSECWGQDGYFTMPYAYVTNQDLATDFWTIKSIVNLEQATLVRK